ncbi:DNA methyltransferase [Amycolatopsis sp. NPDC004079]
MVLDPFCGSGTTGIAALEHGCSFVGIDLDPACHDLARRRLTGGATS